jgi:hypothetical protein
MCVDYMKEYPLLVGAGILLPLLLILAFLWLVRSDDPKVLQIARGQLSRKKGRSFNGNCHSKEGRSLLTVKYLREYSCVGGGRGGGVLLPPPPPPHTRPPLAGLLRRSQGTSDSN